MLQLVPDLGFDLNEVDESHIDALWYACQLDATMPKHVKVIRWLLTTAQVNPNNTRRRTNLAFPLATVSATNSSGLFHMLLDHGADINAFSGVDQSTALHAAVIACHFDN